MIKLLPLVLPVGFLLTAGTIVTVGNALSANAWMSLLDNSELWISLGHTFFVSMMAAGISVALGSVLAWCVYRLPKFWHGLAMLYKIPLILPHIVIASLAILFFSQSGLFSAVASQLGLIDNMHQFPSILYRGYGLGIIFAYVFKEISFVMLMFMGVLRRLNENLVISARMLGASPARVFFTIVIPHLVPMMRICFVVLSLYAMGAFEIPWFIGKTRPQMISVTVYNLYFNSSIDHQPEADALLSILLLFSVVFLYVFLLPGRRKIQDAF